MRIINADIVRAIATDIIINKEVRIVVIVSTTQAHVSSRGLVIVIHIGPPLISTLLALQPRYYRHLFDE